MDASLQRQVGKVLDVLSRAQRVFGCGQQPGAPPPFLTVPDLENDLGRGQFG